MVKWREVTKPYRVFMPSYWEGKERVGTVTGEHRGIGGSGPLVRVYLRLSQMSVAAIKAHCRVCTYDGMEGTENVHRSCG